MGFLEKALGPVGEALEDAGDWVSDHTDDLIDATVTIATGGLNKVAENVLSAGNPGSVPSDGVGPIQAKVEQTALDAQKELTGLGRDQLNEVKRQYDQNYSLAKPIIDAQVDILNQSKTQGDDYYNYMISKQRPVEDALNALALKDTSAEDKAMRDQILNAGIQMSDNTQARAQQMREQIEAVSREAVNFINDQANAVASQASANAGKLRDHANTFYGEQNKDIATYKLGNQGIYDLYRNDVDVDVNNAVADVRAGQSQATNQAIRQALRYGVSMPLATGALTTSQAQAIAAAANGTRNASIDKYRGLIGDGINFRQNAFGASSNAITNANNAEATAAANALAAKNSAVSQALGSITGAIGKYADMAGLSDAQKVSALSTNRDLAIQDQSKDWAKKLDVAGLYRGLPGASQGAYSMANTAGNSAVNNSIAPSATYNAGNSVGNNAVGSGYQMALNGLGSVLNSQTSIHNAGLQANAAETAAKYGAIGSVVGTAAGAAGFASDRRLKQHIVPVGQDERTGLGLYEFSYIDDPVGKRYRGVMADEVLNVMPDAVIVGEDGFMRVVYDMLGIDFVEVV